MHDLAVGPASLGWLPLSRISLLAASFSHLLAGCLSAALLPECVLIIDCVLEPGCISGDRAGLAGQPRIDPWRRAPTTIYAAQFSALGFRL